MASNNTVRLCKQQCLCTGCEHQCKESLLNMTIAGSQNTQSSASFKACVGEKKKLSNSYSRLELCASCFETNHSMKASPRADCLMSWPLITPADFRGAGRASLFCLCHHNWTESAEGMPGTAAPGAFCMWARGLDSRHAGFRVYSRVCTLSARLPG